MGVPFPVVSDVTIQSSQKKNEQVLNEIFTRLLRNDLYIGGDVGLAPTTWECRWYNDQTIKGYSRGDACWLNTENEQSFITANADTIYNYGSNNPYIRNIIKPLSEDASQISLYRNILSGYYSEEMAHPLSSLFYLGDQTKPTQIRVSRIDDNKHPVTDDMYWKSVFARMDEVSDVVDAQLCSTMDRLLDSHLSAYHMNLSSVPTDDRLKKNFENVTLQKYGSYEQDYSISGYDCMISTDITYPTLDFDTVALPELNGMRIAKVRSRKWNSGLVENEGTVAVGTDGIAVVSFPSDYRYLNADYTICVSPFGFELSVDRHYKTTRIKETDPDTGLSTIVVTTTSDVSSFEIIDISDGPYPETILSSEMNYVTYGLINVRTGGFSISVDVNSRKIPEYFSFSTRGFVRQ
jgi:hypothetical protein